MITDILHDKKEIVRTLKNNMNFMGYSIVAIRAKELKIYTIYILNGFLTEEKIGWIERELATNEIPAGTIATIKLTDKAEYEFNYDELGGFKKAQECMVIISDALRQNVYVNGQFQVPENQFGSKLILVSKEDVLVRKVFDKPVYNQTPNTTQPQQQSPNKEQSKDGTAHGSCKCHKCNANIGTVKSPVMCSPQLGTGFYCESCENLIWQSKRR